MKRPSSLLLQLLFLCALVAGTALVLQPVQRGLLVRMEQVKAMLIGQAERELGRHITYGSMGPSLLGTIDIRSVRIFGADGNNVISVARIRLSYSLLDLVSKRGLASIQSVLIDQPVVTLDSRRDADLLDRFRGDGSGTSFKLKDLSSLSLTVRNGSCIWRDGQDRYSLSDLNLKASPGENQVSFKGKARLEASSGGSASIWGRVAASFSAQGSVSNDFTSGTMTLALPSVSGPNLSLKSQTALVMFNPEQIEFRKIQDRSPFDLSARYERGTGTWSAELTMDSFALRNVASVSGSWQRYDRFLSSRLSGSADLAYSKAAGLSYHFDIAAKAPFVGDSLCDIQLSGEGQGAGLSIRKAAVFTDGKKRASYAGQLSFAPFAVQGTLAFNDFPVSPDLSLTTSILFSTQKEKVSLFAENCSLGDISFSAVEGAFSPSSEEYLFNLSFLRFSNTDDYENVHLGKLSLEGSWTPSGVNPAVFCCARFISCRRYPETGCCDYGTPELRSSLVP